MNTQSTLYSILIGSDNVHGSCSPTITQSWFQSYVAIVTRGRSHFVICIQNGKHRHDTYIAIIATVDTYIPTILLMLLKPYTFLISKYTASFVSKSKQEPSTEETHT